MEKRGEPFLLVVPRGFVAGGGVIAMKLEAAEQIVSVTTSGSRIGRKASRSFCAILDRRVRAG
jgi:hypothetical protein